MATHFFTKINLPSLNFIDSFVSDYMNAALLKH